MESVDISHSEEIYTVSQLNREIRFLLEGNFPAVWIEGEISNFAAPNSGHWYFSLKDNTAQVRCAMFRPQNRRLSFLPKEGMHVFLKARVSLYEGRGDFQLLVEHMEEAGEGKLRQEFEALKKRLQDAGLFNEAHKKPLPAFPTCIGVVTSPTGAAIRDILSVLKRRYPCVPVIIYPTLVQGNAAAPNIVKAIETANRRNECQVLIIARGGGSLEDLWPFNDEAVAHAIYRSAIPTISGVGHEIDFTIADFVADLRAPTPSVAAELATPDRAELLSSLVDDRARLHRVINHQLQRIKQSLTFTQKHLYQQHPKRKLAEQSQQLDFYEITLIQLQNKLLAERTARLNTLKATFSRVTPLTPIREIHHQLNLNNQRLQSDFKKILQQKQQTLVTLSTKLDAISPLATLQRGFAIATKDQTVLQNVDQTKPGDKIHVRLQHGTLNCTVDERDYA